MVGKSWYLLVFFWCPHFMIILSGWNPLALVGKHFIFWCWNCLGLKLKNYQLMIIFMNAPLEFDKHPIVFPIDISKHCIPNSIPTIVGLVARLALFGTAPVPQELRRMRRQSHLLRNQEILGDTKKNPSKHVRFLGGYIYLYMCIWYVYIIIIYIYMIL